MREEGSLLPLMEQLGHTFRNVGLLCCALTHPSATAGSGKDNQRLEFLGDAVLQLCVTDALYRQYPEKEEGPLTQMRASMVREETLAGAARQMNLGAYLRLDHGEALSGGREKPSVLADALEAVLGAIYLDAGLQTASTVCQRLLSGFPPQEAEPNWKSALQEQEQANGYPAPVYRLLDQSGPPHAATFTAEAMLHSTGQKGIGQGPSKKQAEQNAAKAILTAQSPLQVSTVPWEAKSKP